MHLLISDSQGKLPAALGIPLTAEKLGLHCWELKLEVYLYLEDFSWMISLDIFLFLCLLSLKTA